jgi:hypothetical protein
VTIRCQEVLARVDIDAADDPLGELTEIGGEVEEEVGARGEQEHAAQRAFDRDQAKDESCARRVAGPHRQNLSTSAHRSPRARGSDPSGVPANRQAAGPIGVSLGRSP